MPCFSCLRPDLKTSDEAPAHANDNEVPEMCTDDETSPAKVEQGDIKAARQLASKLGLKPPPDRTLPAEFPDPANSRNSQGSKRPASSRLRNGRGNGSEKFSSQQGGQQSQEAVKRPLHKDMPAFLAVEPPVPLKKQQANGRVPNGTAIGTTPPKQSQSNSRLSADLEHNSPPSFKGFLTESAKLDEIGQDEEDIMDSQDIWTPKKMSSNRVSSSGSLMNDKPKPSGGSSPPINTRLNSAAPKLRAEAASPSTSWETGKAEFAERRDGGPAWSNQYQPNVVDASETQRASFAATPSPRNWTSSSDSLTKGIGRVQSPPSLVSEGSLGGKSGFGRVTDAPKAGLNPARRPSLSSVSRTSSLGSESLRDSDSGARLLQHTKSGSLSGTPQELGQAGADLYEMVGQLGIGRTGITKLMRDRRSNELVAAKWVQHTAGETLSVQTEREIVNHRRLLHPNVVRFREVFATDEHLVIVMDYASVGHLSERIATGGALVEEKAKDFYRQLVDGMVYCHKQGIVHRNLRMENMLLDGQYFRPVLKISGFGYSKAPDLDSAPKTMELGSPAYSPPEMLIGARNEGYDGRAMDVWSSGVILFNLLTGSMPFQDTLEPGILSRKLMQRIANCIYEFPLGTNFSPECKDLIAQIFVANPKRRIDSYFILNHPWLAGTSLPTAEPVVISKQSENDISLVMDRARKRRAARNAAQRKQREQPNLFNEDLLDD